MHNLRELLPRLREADAKLNEALERLEDVLEVELPRGSYGRILLSRPDRTHHCWTHLVYNEGVLWVETWTQKHGFHTEDVINHDIRENKLLACKRIADLWIACGGDPARVGRKSTDPIGIE